MSRPRVVYSTSHARDIAESLKRERPDLDPADYLHLLYVQRVGRVVDVVYDRHCRKEYGISGSDMRVIFALRRAGPCYTLRPTELFRSLLVTSGAITKQVDRLISLGFVERRHGPKKSGGYLIHLTDKGCDVADEALASLGHTSVLSEAALTREERIQLQKLLEKVLEDIEKQMLEDENVE